MRLVPLNKSVETPLLCFRYHRDYADATCPECRLRIPGGPYDAAQYARYFHMPMQAQAHVDVGHAGDPTPSHQAAKAALELADAAHQAGVVRLHDLVRRVALVRSEAEAELLRDEEVVIQDELHEADERAVKARVRFNAEERLRARRIQAATAKAEGRS